MTYKELIEELRKLTDEQLECDVTIEDADREFYKAELEIVDPLEEDRLGKNHPVIAVP